MAGIDETVVREYFETNGFLVRQLRKYVVQGRDKRSDEELDFMVYNPAHKQEERQPGFMLFPNDLPFIHRAVVSIKPWHSHRFTPATLRGSADIFKFLERDVLKQAEALFNISADLPIDSRSLMKILVLPGLPTHEPHKSQSIELLKKAGVDGILSFRSILQDILDKLEVNHNYQKSDLLQILRILKNYDMIKAPQLELFPSGRKG